MAPATARGIIERAGVQAGLFLRVHPHMLRHVCGFYSASPGNDTRGIQAYLGHKIFSILFAIRNCLLNDLKIFG